MDYAGQGVANANSAAVQVKSSEPVSRVVLPGLEDGACMRFTPTNGHVNQTVFIDAGHGGLDPGVVGATAGHQVLEKDAALAVASRLAALLRADGYGVVMSRTRDTTVIKLAAADSNYGAITSSAVHRDLAARAACANATGANVLVSIHFDGFSDPSVGLRPTIDWLPTCSRRLQRGWAQRTEECGPTISLRRQPSQGLARTTTTSSSSARSHPDGSTIRARCPVRWWSRCSSRTPPRR